MRHKLFVDASLAILSLGGCVQQGLQSNQDSTFRALLARIGDKFKVHLVRLVEQEAGIFQGRRSSSIFSGSRF